MGKRVEPNAEEGQAQRDADDENVADAHGQQRVIRLDGKFLIKTRDGNQITAQQGGKADGDFFAEFHGSAVDALAAQAGIEFVRITDVAKHRDADEETAIEREADHKSGHDRRPRLARDE
jgi:hypothetical protein